jgi:serine/threonine-protein kinase
MGENNTGSDIWLAPVGGQPKPFLQTTAFEVAPAVSPHGRWIAYHSNESGRDEIYVRRFPDGERLQQISNSGGMFPRWRQDGRELFYWTGAAFNVVDVQDDSEEFRHGNPRELFKTSFTVVAPFSPYDVAPDGQRFVFIKEETPAVGPTQVNVVQDWVEELERR